MKFVKIFLPLSLILFTFPHCATRKECRRRQTKAERVVKIARSLLGVSKRRFDCSNFVRYVYRQIGIYLPRTVAQQIREGRRVSRRSLRPADLVFFATVKKTASHVGIYLGRGEFIHISSRKKKAIISHLRSSYYRSRFIQARRVIEE